MHKLRQQSSIWATVKAAEQDGLICINEDNDAISATNRLLWTYPGLHEVLVRIINEWSEGENIEHLQWSEVIQTLAQD